MTYDDVPKDALVAHAEQVLAANPNVAIHFKATCPQCGARPMFSEPNTMYELMECSECGHEFPFVEGNYVVIARLT